MLWLAGLFGVVALVYASVGFGGGSTYTALLALWGVDYRLIPVIALFCNIIVVTGGSIRFVRAGLVSWPQVLPLLLIGYFRRCRTAGGSVGHRWRHIHGTCPAPHPLGRGAPDRSICVALYSDKLGRGAIWPNH